MAPKVAPKCPQGTFRRDRTKAVSGAITKIRLSHDRPVHPCPICCLLRNAEGCCALHATMVYSDVILLYSIQQASGLPDRTAKIADEATVIEQEQRRFIKDDSSPANLRFKQDRSSVSVKTAEGDFLPPFEIRFPRSLRNGLAVAHERHLAHQISASANLSMR